MTSMQKKKTDLVRALGKCETGFGQVAALLSKVHPDETDFGELLSAWEKYYCGPFFRFDKLLQAYVQREGAGYGYLLPISISHHNLHRLFEVLQIEIGDQRLHATRVPERIHDLSEILRQLMALLKRTRGF